VRALASGDQITTPGVAVVDPHAAADIVHGRWVSRALHDGERPVDAIMAAAARASGVRSIGVVLTGRLDDGAQGVRAIKRSGGRVLVQAPATAEAPSMPMAALATGCADFVLPVPGISACLIALTMVAGACDLLRVSLPGWASLA
jgi:two-component system chemotaxis response regulator CheB